MGLDKREQPASWTNTTKEAAGHLIVVARKEKIEEVELKLRKLERVMEAVHENLIYLKSRETEMRVV